MRAYGGSAGFACVSPHGGVPGHALWAEVGGAFSA